MHDILTTWSLRAFVKFRLFGIQPVWTARHFKLHACADSPTKYWHPQQLPTPRSMETFLARLYNVSCCRIPSGCYANVLMIKKIGNTLRTVNWEHS